MRGQAKPKTSPTFKDILPEADLAVRWGKSVRTLQRMRSTGGGPLWFAIGRTVFYRLSDVFDFEETSTRKEAP